MEHPARTRVDATARAERIHDPGARFRTLAAGLCVLSAAIALLVLLVAASSWPADGPSALALLGIPLGIVVLLVLAWGLVSETAWSVPMAILLLCWLVAIGGVEVAEALTRGGIHIPLAAIAALLILTQRPRGDQRPAVHGRDRWIVAMLMGAYLAASLWPYAAGYLSAP